jgi:hypothetical protein
MDGRIYTRLLLSVLAYAYHGSSAVVHSQHGVIHASLLSGLQCCAMWE